LIYLNHFSNTHRLCKFGDDQQANVGHTSLHEQHSVDPNFGVGPAQDEEAQESVQGQAQHQRNASKLIKI
jgi:hypothetical protein